MVKAWKLITVTQNIRGRIGLLRLKCRRCHIDLAYSKEQIWRHRLNSHSCKPTKYYCKKCYKSLWF